MSSSPHCWELCYKVFENVKVGSSCLLGDFFFPACFLPCASRSRGRHSRRLARLRLHVLRAYCNFESKQAISITLFGRRPNNNNNNMNMNMSMIKIINK